MSADEICQFVIKALRVSEDEDIVSIIVDTIRRNGVAWTALDRWQGIVNALMERLHQQDGKGRHHVHLAGLLMELRDQGRLSEDDRHEVKASVKKHISVSSSPHPGRIKLTIYRPTWN
jgi:mediator of RNA polymerase II transcription subunit 12